MTKYLTDLRLGELLVKTGLVSVKQVSDVVKIAGNQNLQFGQMLVKSGWLKTSELEAGLAAQSAIRDRVLDKTEASRALITACKKGISFEEAIKISPSAPESNSSNVVTNKLGELLVESGLLPADECAQALMKIASTGLPLGRTLITSGKISEEVLMNLLEIQLRVRDGILTREMAIEVLRRPASSSELDEAPSGQHVVRLGTLLIRAGILDRADVTNVLEIGLQTGKRMGELLVKYGFLNESLLETALTLQQMIDNSFLEVEQAASILRHVEKTNASISDALVELKIVTAPESATSASSTFGLADAKTRKVIPKTRVRRLMNSLKSAEEPRFSELIGEAYGGLISAYSRLARKHLVFENFDEAEWLLERVLALKLQMFGPFHPRLVRELLRISEVLIKLNKCEQAQRTAMRAVEILENTKPYNGPLLADALNMLGMIYFEQRYFEDAEPLLSRALTLREMYLPISDPRVADTLRDYARLLAATQRVEEASRMHFQARTIMMRNKNAEVQPPTFFEHLYLNALRNQQA